jgi:hypothetical protein
LAALGVKPFSFVDEPKHVQLSEPHVLSFKGFDFIDEPATVVSAFHDGKSSDPEILLHGCSPFCVLSGFADGDICPCVSKVSGSEKGFEYDLMKKFMDDPTVLFNKYRASSQGYKALMIFFPSYVFVAVTPGCCSKFALMGNKKKLLSLMGGWLQRIYEKFNTVRVVDPFTFVPTGSYTLFFRIGQHHPPIQLSMLDPFPFEFIGSSFVGRELVWIRQYMTNSLGYVPSIRDCAIENAEVSWSNSSSNHVHTEFCGCCLTWKFVLDGKSYSYLTTAISHVGKIEDLVSQFVYDLHSHSPVTRPDRNVNFVITCKPTWTLRGVSGSPMSDVEYSATSLNLLILWALSHNHTPCLYDTYLGFPLWCYIPFVIRRFLIETWGKHLIPSLVYPELVAKARVNYLAGHKFDFVFSPGLRVSFSRKADGILLVAHYSKRHAGVVTPHARSEVYSTFDDAMDSLFTFLPLPFDIVMV